MDGTGNQEGGGASQDPTVGSGGSSGAPAGGAAGQQGNADPSGGAPAGIDRKDLHPALRDMTGAQITELFESMAGALRGSAGNAGGQPPANMEPPLGMPAHANVPPPPIREQPKRLTKEQMREFFDPNSDKFDPQAAVIAVAQENFGSLIGDINRRSIAGLFGMFRQNIPDFQEYEADISTALQGRDPATITERDVLDTFLRAKGLKATLKERAERAARSATTVPPTPKNPDEPKEPELDALELQVANQMFRKEESGEKRIKMYKEWKKRDEKGELTMKVPVGGGKKV